MMMQVLAPGMEYRYEADARAQMFGIGGNLQERFGRGAKEQAIDDPLILEGQGRKRLGQRKDEVKVVNW